MWQGWFPPESAHKRRKVLLSGRHWVGLLMINFLKVRIFFPLFARKDSEPAPAFTVCSLYVLTDGFSLIFYLMLEKIKLMICCLFNLQEEKNKKGSLREALMVEKSGPKYHLAFLKRRSTAEPFKSDFLPPPPCLLQNI